MSAAVGCRCPSAADCRLRTNLINACLEIHDVRGNESEFRRWSLQLREALSAGVNIDDQLALTWRFPWLLRAMEIAPTAPPIIGTGMAPESKPVRKLPRRRGRFRDERRVPPKLHWTRMALRLVDAATRVAATRCSSDVRFPVGKAGDRFRR